MDDVTALWMTLGEHAGSPTPAEIVACISATFDDEEFHDHTALRLILDEEGPEALVEAVLDANNTIWGVRWQQQFHRAEHAEVELGRLRAIVTQLADDALDVIRTLHSTPADVHSKALGKLHMHAMNAREATYTNPAGEGK